MSRKKGMSRRDFVRSGLLHRRFVRHDRGPRALEHDSRLGRARRHRRLSGAGVHFPCSAETTATICWFRTTPRAMRITPRFAPIWRWHRIRCCPSSKPKVRESPVRPASRTLPGLQGLFNSGQMALVANVGTLAQPLTQAQYQANSGDHSQSIFSRTPTSKAQWQTAQFDGFAATGWAGRTADKLQSLNAGAQFPPITSVAGGAILVQRRTDPTVRVDSRFHSGLERFSRLDASDNARLVAFQQLLTFDSGISLVQDTSAVMTQTLARARSWARR